MSDKITYKAGVYFNINGAMMRYEKRGFDTVKEATEWLHNAFKWFMLNWATINDSGLIIDGEVTDDLPENSIGFSDIYELRCGY